jgi:hypothetical protein
MASRAKASASLGLIARERAPLVRATNRSTLMRSAKTKTARL